MSDLSANKILIDGFHVGYETENSGDFHVTYGAVQRVNILSCMEEFRKITLPRVDEILADLCVSIEDHRFSWEEEILYLYLTLHESYVTCDLNILTIIEIEYDRFCKIVESVNLRAFAVKSIRPIVDDFGTLGTRESAKEWQIILTCADRHCSFLDLFRVREDISRASYPVGIHGGDENLLFRFYIPAGRLYAAEADRLLSLFREWLTSVERFCVRQDGYRTAAGQVFEFFGDAPLKRHDLSEKFTGFANFLAMCADDPSSAVVSLSQQGFDRASAETAVGRYGREVRRLRLDLKQERESRLLAIQHSLESDFLDGGLDSRQWGQIGNLIEDLTPEVTDTAPMPLMSASRSVTPMSTFTVTINQQVIRAVESTVIQNIQGTANIGAQANEFLEIVRRFGGQERASLESAIYEYEDLDARPSSRIGARNRLKGFLLHLGDKVEESALAALTKYLETKIGI